jgi:dsRNA-specific ribonuclease
MALTKASMADFVEAHIAAVTLDQGSDAAAALAYRRKVLEALCQGIIDEIKENAVIETTSGAPDSEHIGKVY